MPYAVLPATVPDISPVYDVYFAAFKDEQILDFLYPGGVDRQKHKHGTTLWWMHDTNGYTVKCVDSDTGAVVGMSSWEVFWRPGKVWERPKGAEWLKGDDKTKAEEVLEPLWDMRGKLFGGRKHVYCMTMATHPEYQRKGIGKLMVQWGIQVAEQLGLPIYLESTVGGEALYKSQGFETLKHESVVHKPAVTGKKEDTVVPLMVRMPSKAGGISFKEWADKGYPEF